MPSSVVVYRSPRPYTPFSKLTKAEWRNLYHEAIRLCFEPEPESPSLVPTRAVVIYGRLAQGSTPNMEPLFNPGILASSLLLYSPQFNDLAQDSDPPLLSVTCESPEVPIPPKGLALTSQVVTGPERLMLFRIMVFPAAVEQGRKLVPVLTWQTYGGALTDLQLIRSEYMSPVQLSANDALSATLSSSVFTDSHAIPSISVTTLEVTPIE
jgi:hypothetical protein